LTQGQALLISCGRTVAARRAIMRASAFAFMTIVIRMSGLAVLRIATPASFREMRAKRVAQGTGRK
jgi:hypothetical protein